MRKKHKFFPILVTILLLLLGTGISFYINAEWSKKELTIKNTLASQVTNENSMDLKSVIHQSQKHVVQIETITEYSQKNGSGFIYNDKGDIITNAHVVKDASSIYVKTANARTYTAALVDIGETTDIAVIRVPQLANQSPANIDDNYTPEIGNEVIAVGSPLGFQNSVTLGIISGTNRTFNIDEYEYEDVYQISANITNGNSGGPLIDSSTGKIIGINSAGIEDGSIGFSIPLNSVLDIVKKWSDEADDRVLEYDSLTNNTQIENPEQLKEDADYIVGYFFDSLSIRDYFNAYAMFGSEWQTSTSYQEFRNKYIHIVETVISDKEITFLGEDKQVQVTLTGESVTIESNQKSYNEVYNYTFMIGFENDQLKILNYTSELISSEPIETETETDQQS